MKSLDRVRLVFCVVIGTTVSGLSVPNCVTAGETASGPRCFKAFEWNLNLPDRPVSRRISRSFSFQGPEPTVLGEMEGPGCIRRFWITGNNIGRDVVLRIYFDDQPVPYVEAPLSDFFGVMHNLSERDAAYRINTPFLAVKPKNGMTCYFPMPFAKKARVEVTGSQRGTHLYYMIDWHEYPGQKLDEPLRFCARWRRECPTVPYADQFLMLDADGPGQLVGFVYSVDMLNSRHVMRWSHAGADTVYLDGHGDHPAVLFGIGGEDTFGTSYSGGDYVAQTSLFSDMPYYEQKDQEGDKQKVVGYRFFVNDAVHFRDSIYLRFCCREHDIASTVYWYSTKPVRPFFQMPPREDRLPGATIHRKYDVPLPDSGNWWITGGFPSEFDAPPPTQPDFNPDGLFHGSEWIRYASKRGFVEFNDWFGPPPSNGMPTASGVAYARCVVQSPADLKATARIGWDEHLVVRINDGEPRDLGDHSYFQAKTFELPLRKGPNVVGVRLSNSAALSRGAWCFSFHLTTLDGKTLLPQAPGEKRTPSVGFWKVPEGKLLAHWTLDGNAEDGVVEDSSGNGHHANLSRTMSPDCWQAGRIGKAIRFDGKDDYLRIAGPLARADLGEAPFSVTAWVRTTDPGLATIVYRKDQDQNPKIELDMEGGLARFRLRNADGQTFDCDSTRLRVDDGAWHHLAAVRDTNEMRLYVDGQLVARQELPDGGGSFSVQYPAYWHIGSCVTGRGDNVTHFFHGDIDDVRIFSSVLDNDQIGALTKQ